VSEEVDCPDTPPLWSKEKEPRTGGGENRKHPLEAGSLISERKMGDSVQKGQKRRGKRTDRVGESELGNVERNRGKKKFWRKGDGGDEKRSFEKPTPRLDP